MPGLYDYFPALVPADSGRMTVVFGQSGPGGPTDAGWTSVVGETAP